MADQPPVEFGDAAPPPGRVRPTSNLSQARDLDVALFDADADGPREPWLAVKGAEVLFNASRKALRVVLPLMQMSRQAAPAPKTHRSPERAGRTSTREHHQHSKPLPGATVSAPSSAPACPADDADAPAYRKRWPRLPSGCVVCTLVLRRAQLLAGSSMPIDTVVTDDKAPTAPMGALPFLPVIPPLDLQRVGMVACQHPSFWFCAWLHAAKLQAENGTLRTTIEELVPRFFFKALNTLLVQGAQPAVPGFPPSAYVSPAKSALGSELLRLLQLSGPSQQGDHDVIRFVQTHEHPVKVLEQALARAKLLPRSELVVTSHRDLIKESLRKSNAALRFLLYPYTAVSLPVPTNLAYASSPPFSGTPAAWSQSVAGFSHPAMQHQLRLHHQQQQQQQQQQRQQKQQHQQQKQQQQLMLQELQRRQRGNRRDPRSSNNTAEERSSTATGTVGASTLHHGHPPYFSFGSPRAWSGAPAVSMHMPPGMPFGALVPMRTGAPGLFHGETPWPFDPTRTPPQKAGGAHGAVASGTRRSESVRSADSRALHGSPTVQHAEKLPHTAVGSDGAPPAKRPRLRVSSVDNEVGRSLVAMAHSKTAGADARMSTSLHPSGVAGIKDDEPWPPVNTIGDLFAVGSSSSTQDRKCMLCSTDRVRGRLPLNFVESYSSTAAPVGLWWLCHRCGLFLRRHYGCSGYQTHVKCGPRAIRPKCRKKLENIQRMTGLRLKRPPSPASASNKVPGSDGSEAGDIVVDTSQAPHRSKGRVTRGTSKRLSSPST